MTKHVVERNTIKDMDHTFVVQHVAGESRTHFVYVPRYYNVRSFTAW